MLIVDELPFRFVEGLGFRHLMNVACPRFIIQSKWTVTRDCYQLYLDERSKLKTFLKNHSQTVCLTTDSWTSIQKIHYMCVTCHFIDDCWNLHKRILSFVPVTGHKGEYIAKILESCLHDWGLRNIFTITVDNASSNDTAIACFKRRMISWGNFVANCEYLHMRCIAHVLNLVVNDGIKDISESIRKVREAVRYIRNSPARFRNFKEIASYLGVESKKSICLDVPTH